jgi:hypothetical protein
MARAAGTRKIRSRHKSARLLKPLLPARGALGFRNMCTRARPVDGLDSPGGLVLPRTCCSATTDLAKLRPSTIINELRQRRCLPSSEKLDTGTPARVQLHSSRSHVQFESAIDVSSCHRLVTILLSMLTVPIRPCSRLLLKASWLLSSLLQVSHRVVPLALPASRHSGWAPDYCSLHRVDILLAERVLPAAQVLETGHASLA